MAPSKQFWEDAPPATSWWGLALPGLDEQRSPLYYAPAWLRNALKVDSHSMELANALGRGEIPLHAHSRALELAGQNASAWGEWGHHDGATHLQIAVSLGWLDLAEALLENDRAWFWKTRWGKRLRTRHLASLWFFVPDDEVAQWVSQKCSLEELGRIEGSRALRTLYWLAVSLAQAGVVNALREVHDRLPSHLQQRLLNGMEPKYLGMEPRNWPMRSVECMLRLHPQALSNLAMDTMPWSHVLQATVQGQALLESLGCTDISCDVVGNTPLRAWCLAPSQLHIADTYEDAQASLNALLAKGVDPFARNFEGKTVLQDAASPLYPGLLRRHQGDMHWTRVEILQRTLQAWALEKSTTPVNLPPSARRL